MEKLVSVVVPAYNCEKFVSQTLECLFAQDYPNIEIIVVNDGSKDNTLDILKSYGKKIVLVDQMNTGAPGARNQGMSRSSGEFICFCDADDLWSQSKVSDQVSYFNQHPEVGMVCSSWQVWEADNEGNFDLPSDFKNRKNGLKKDSNYSGWIYHKLLLDCICLTSAVMLRRSIIGKVGVFDVKLWNGDDYDYWIRISRVTEIHRLRSQQVLYRILPQSVARTPTKRHYEYEVLQNALKQWGEVGPTGGRNSRGQLSDRIMNMCFGFGYLHLKSGDPGLAMQSFFRSLQQNPLAYKLWIYLLLAFLKKLKAIFIDIK